MCCNVVTVTSAAWQLDMQNLYGDITNSSVSDIKIYMVIVMCF